jgi:hypothetical protein
MGTQWASNQAHLGDVLQGLEGQRHAAASTPNLRVLWMNVKGDKVSVTRCPTLQVPGPPRPREQHSDRAHIEVYISTQGTFSDLSRFSREYTCRPQRI